LERQQERIAEILQGKKAQGWQCAKPGFDEFPRGGRLPMKAEANKNDNEQAKILIKAGLFDLIDRQQNLVSEVQGIENRIRAKLAELKHLEVEEND